MVLDGPDRKKRTAGRRGLPGVLDLPGGGISTEDKEASRLFIVLRVVPAVAPGVAVRPVEPFGGASPVGKPGKGGGA